MGQTDRQTDRRHRTVTSIVPAPQTMRTVPLTNVTAPDTELGHWVTGSMGHLGHLSRAGHRVIILTRCETRVFPVFEKMPKCKTYIWNAEMTEVIVVWPTTSCFADWSKRRHVTLRIIDCQEVVLACYRILITCHPRRCDMSTHVTSSRVTCCKYSAKMKSRVRFPADH